jgi:hypothetical protein
MFGFGRVAIVIAARAWTDINQLPAEFAFHGYLDMAE